MMNPRGKPNSLNIPANTRNVIFDYDGTLATLPIDWVSERTRYREYLRTFGVRDGLLDHMRMDEMEKVALEQGTLTWDEVYFFRKALEATVSGKHHPHPEICAMAELWFLAGKNLIVLSNNFQQTVLNGLEQMNLSAHFQLVVGIDNARFPKPSTAGLDVICKYLLLDPSKTVMVGDSLAADAAFCITTGIHFLHVDSLKSDINNLLFK